MDSDVKWMDLDEFLNDGYLQEVNRQFFHPMGLALAVETDEDGHVTGLAGLWDYRDDPEGIVFGDGYGDDPEKARKVWEALSKHIEYRQEHLGYVIQPVADSTDA